MPQGTLEERVAVLEQQMGALLVEHRQTQRAKNWRRTRGAFTGDEVMKRVFDEGRKIRDAERKRAAPRKSKKRRAT